MPLESQIKAIVVRKPTPIITPSKVTSIPTSESRITTIIVPKPYILSKSSNTPQENKAIIAIPNKAIIVIPIPKRLALLAPP